MSTQNVIVVPVAGEGARQPGQDTTEIASTIQHALEENAHPTQPQPGPLKQIIAHQESLYQYINWNDPTRTLGSYIGVLSLLFGAHYLPLTQIALKGGVTALGSLYWLVKAVPPFWLAVLAVTSVYAAPLIASPRSRKMAREAGTNAQELAAAATHNGRMLAHDASTGAQKLANTVTETSRAATNSISSGAQEVANQGNVLAQKGKQTAAGLSSQAKGTASSVSNSATESFKQAQAASSTTTHGKEHAYTNTHGPTHWE
ncbi:hypothetical protein GGP41_010533 [Bipolaris sorokiniana]|uniref:Uncharacterized protein n=1 Tax=Cochliobolus sativus TaxID=45130 RepID=A0A8H5ZND7_COCSA|nr:hypothetical protein GGP41_010533 [Bipolaris sorokiniana]